MYYVTIIHYKARKVILYAYHIVCNLYDLQIKLLCVGMPKSFVNFGKLLVPWSPFGLTEILLITMPLRRPMPQPFALDISISISLALISCFHPSNRAIMRDHCDGDIVSTTTPACCTSGNTFITIKYLTYAPNKSILM